MHHIIGSFLSLLLSPPYKMGTHITIHADNIHNILDHYMEGGDQSAGNGGSRWNPTKEQINMLESLYKQGLRTPTAEQIQQITARLRDFGHIEGKNVFYWFQNHKARQRQKQKQDSFAYYNRFLHPTTPLFPSYPNVVCSPCYIAPPKSDAVYYHQYPKVPLSTAGGSFKRSRLIPDQSINDQRYNKKQEMRQETLDLFPIHPTGILQSRNGNPNSCSNNDPSMSNSTDQNGRVHANHGCDGDEDEDDGHPFFDFFCGNS